MNPAESSRPTVSGVFETVLYATNIPEVAAFYAGVLGVPLLRESSEQSAVFRLSAESMLLIFNPQWSERTGRGAPAHGSRGQGHVALRIGDCGYEAWRAWLVEKGVEIEMEVAWPTGGRSIYFRDPAGNSVELAAGNVWGG